MPLFAKHDVLSVFGLGLFSGLASSCCGPVLAGVLTLTALSASYFQALVLILVYVFGMVFPLFILGYFWDSLHLGQSKLVSKLARGTNFISGALFLSMGIFILYLSATNKITQVSLAQTQLVALFSLLQAKILELTKNIPDWLFLLGLILIILFFLKKAKTN